MLQQAPAQDEGQYDGYVQGGSSDQHCRVYAATTDEAVQDAAVIIGTLTIHSTPTLVLFDSGSTHTLIATTFAARVGMTVEDLDYDLTVLTPTRVVLTTAVCVRDVSVVIQRRILLTDFTVLPMREFDAIFGMDWMTCHRALIDCQMKKVQLHLRRNVQMAFQGRG